MVILIRYMQIQQWNQRKYYYLIAKKHSRKKFVSKISINPKKQDYETAVGGTHLKAKTYPNSMKSNYKFKKKGLIIW